MMFIKHDDSIINLATATKIDRKPYYGELTIWHGNSKTMIGGSLADKVWEMLCEKSIRGD